MEEKMASFKLLIWQSNLPRPADHPYLWCALTQMEEAVMDEMIKSIEPKQEPEDDH